MSVVRLDNVSKVYPGTIPVAALRPTSLTIAEGDFISIVGPSGSGKSTLLNMLGLLDKPSSGTVTVGDRDTGGLRDSDVARLRGQSIGFVFQAFHLLDYRTAVDNVALGLLYAGVPGAQRRRRAKSALALVGLQSREASRPTEMSGGERQRVSIARALVGEPALILCDEPTGNLDRANADAIMSAISALNEQGRTIVVVTHDASVARRCRRRLSVSDGVVTELPARTEGVTRA